MSKKAEKMAKHMAKVVKQFELDRAPELAVRVGMLEAGLRELYAAVEGGTTEELQSAMELARGLLMQSDGEFNIDN